MEFFQELAEQTAIIERLQEKFKFVVFDGDIKEEFKFKNIYNIYSFMGKKEFWESEEVITTLFEKSYLEAKEKIKSAIIHVCISDCKKNYLTRTEGEMRGILESLFIDETDDLEVSDDIFYNLCQMLQTISTSELNEIIKGDYGRYCDSPIYCEDCCD